MNVGDYVRTKDGVIQKITDVFNTSMEITTNRGQRIYRYIDIVKSSPQIIDLIEIGDYVNGLKVQGVNNEIKGFGTIIFSKDSSIMEDYIYTIVTHEQMENIQYRVEK